MDFVTYIIWSDKLKKFYIGHTGDLKRRLEYHNASKSTWTKRGIPWKLVYYETFPTRGDAMAREKYLKSIKNPSYLTKIIKDRGVEQW